MTDFGIYCESCDENAAYLWAAESNIAEALELIVQYGGIDGAHHKQWVLDQVVRKLTGPTYLNWVVEQCNGKDGPNTYEWDEGIAP